jgi:hypothetical protein
VPELQLQPAKVFPSLENPDESAKLKVAPLALLVSVGVVPLPPLRVYVTVYVVGVEAVAVTDPFV